MDFKSLYDISLKGGKNEMNKLIENKRGQTGGLITGIVFGLASLIIGVIIAFVIITTITGANLLGSGAANDSVANLEGNFSAGIDNVSEQVPTVLLIAAIVLILGVLAILVAVWSRMRMGGGNTL